VNSRRLLVVSPFVSWFVAAGAFAQTTQRASVDSNGVQGNNYSGLYGQSISGNGRFVAFNSGATNLIAGGSALQWEVFVHDFLTGETTMASVDSNGVAGSGGSYTPSLSADGLRVAFDSDSGFGTGDSNGRPDVFLHDRASGATTLVSVDANGVQFFGQSRGAAISGDGQSVAFHVTVGVGRYGHKTNVYVKDTRTGALVCASVDPNGAATTQHSADPAISFDGGFVAFQTDQDSLVTGDTNGKQDVVVRDLVAGVTELASVDSSGAQADGVSSDPAISADGRYVAFTSVATNLVAGDTNGRADVFVHDRQTGATTRVSLDSSGGEADADCLHPSLSADGRLVGFVSAATNLVAGDTNGVSDVFVHDTVTGATTRLSVDPLGGEGNGVSNAAQLSADGRFVCFHSVASDLVANDTNGTDDVFLHGPRLTLELDPAVVTAGSALTLSTWRAAPLAPAMLVVVDLDGASLFLPIVVSSCDATGVWSLQATVPGGLAGTTISFQTLAIVDTGKVELSNAATLTIQ
jgi:Tol biopolymer transport system component